MSGDPFGTLYRFVPSVRRGFQPDHQFDPSTLPESAQPEFGVTVDAKGKAREEQRRDPNQPWDTTESGSVDLSLYGPGDVEGLDHSQIVRAEPDPGTQQFQPNYFPFVSFDRPDMPWLFSPERAGDDGRVRPWITLITVEKGEGVEIEPSGTGPLPVMTFSDGVDLSEELPPPEESWAWAHAQLHGAPAGEDQSDWMEWGPEQFSTLSNITVSRLVSPRNLDRGTDYYAAVVPTFASGRAAGIGNDPFENGDSLSYAWDRSDPPSLPWKLPVYYYWEFATTDREVTFERYVENLESVTFGEDVGTKEIDASDPGPPSLASGTGTRETIAFGGALISEPGRDKVDRLSYAYSPRLQTLLNKPKTLRQSTSGPTPPIVGPPRYCQWHAGLEAIPDGAVQLEDGIYDPEWFAELNTTVRNRGAASRGAKIVRRNQSALMNAAWAVAGEIREANDAIRDTVTAGTVGDAAERPRGVEDVTYTPGEFAKLGRRSLERIHRMATIEQLLGEDGLPADPAFPGKDGPGFPEEYTQPPLGGGVGGGYRLPGGGYTDPTGGYAQPGDGYAMPREGSLGSAGSVDGTAGGDPDAGSIDPYASANTSDAVSGLTGTDPVRFAGGAGGELAGQGTGTDSLLGATGATTTSLIEPDADPRPDGGAGTAADGASAGAYAQFLQDFEARPENSRQFQRLVRLDGPLAGRSGATAADYEGLLGSVAAETLHEVEVLVDDTERRTQVRSFAKGSEYWQPPSGLGTSAMPHDPTGASAEKRAADEQDPDEQDPGEQEEAETGAASSDAVPVGLRRGFVSMDASAAHERSDEATAAGVGSSGRTTPLRTVTAEREYRATAAALDDRLPTEERIEPETTRDHPDREEPSEETGEGRSGDEHPRSAGPVEPAVAQLVAVEDHADAILDAVPDDPGTELDAAGLRSAGTASSLVVDATERLTRTVRKALADDDVTIPAERPEAVGEQLAALSSAVDDLVAALPTAPEREGAPDPAAVDGDAVDRAARDVHGEARTLRELLGGLAAAVPMQLRTDSATVGEGYGDPMVETRVSIDRSALGELATAGTQSAYLRGRLAKRLGTEFETGLLERDDPVESVMMAPEFPTPMWRPLKELSAQYMLPGIESVPRDSIGLLTENREFIEAYLAGLNHEFARELLWRGFPTDRRGSYFKRFWNKGRGPAWDLGMGVDTDDDSPKDIGAIHEWDESSLGENEPPGAAGSGEDSDGAGSDEAAERGVENERGDATSDDEEESPDVVLLVRSRLFKLFPHVNVYAGRAYIDEEGKIVPTTPESLSVDPTASDDIQFPSYRGELTDDVTFLGFDLTVDDVESEWDDVQSVIDEADDPMATLGREGDGDQLGYYFVFEERPGEIRFGFDEGTADTADQRPLGIAAGSDVASAVPSWVDLQASGNVDRTGWEDFSWHNLVGGSGSPGDVSYVSIAESQPGKNDWWFPDLETIRNESGIDADAFEDEFDDPPNAHDPAEWGKNSAHMARIAWQKPVRMSRHANVMLPDGDEEQ